MDALLASQLAATWFMVGVIWLVQVAHYPLFDRVGPEHAVPYHRAYVGRMGYVVGPPMLVEAGGALALVGWGAAWCPPHEAWAGLALVAALWATTGLCSVPAHERLSRGWDPGAHLRLVRTNWLRTALWTARGALALLWLTRL